MLVFGPWFIIFLEYPNNLETILFNRVSRKKAIQEEGTVVFLSHKFKGNFV